MRRFLRKIAVNNLVDDPRRKTVFPKQENKLLNVQMETSPGIVDLIHSV